MFFNPFNLKNGNENGTLSLSLLPRVEYFRILLNCCAKLVITSMHLKHPVAITEIAKKLSAFEETIRQMEKETLGAINDIANSYEKNKSEKLKNKFDEQVKLLMTFINENLENAIEKKGAFQDIILSCNFTSIRKQNLESSKEALTNLERDLNVKVQEQVETLSGFWAQEKLQILYFIYISRRELHHLFFRMNYQYETEDTWFQPLINNIRENLRDLTNQILSWPSVFEAKQIFKDFLIQITYLKANIKCTYNGQQPLLLNVLEDIIIRASEIYESFDKRFDSSKYKSTAKDHLDLAQKRLALAMGDTYQMESFIQSAIAFHQQCKSPRIITPEEAKKAENFTTFLPQKGSAVYGMDGSDVTVECLSPGRKICVIGDTHGEMHFASPEVFPDEPSITYGFLGDSTDRGIYIESTLLPLMLQQIDPQNFLIILGNHEYDIIRNSTKEFARQISGEAIQLNLFDKQVSLPVLLNIINQSDGQTKEKFHQLFKKLFNLFPTAVVNERYFLVHGGLKLQASNVASVFANTREFMVTAKYCLSQKEGEIDGSGRPAFNEDTTTKIQAMGYLLGCGHQHEQNDYKFGFEGTTNRSTNPDETPQVVLCSAEKYERVDIKGDLVLFPETIVLQQYLCEIAKEARLKIFGVFDQNLLGNEKEIAMLLKTILLYIYTCIQTDQQLKNNEEIAKFFQFLANAEANAFKILKDEFYKLYLFTQSMRNAEMNVQPWFDMKRGAGIMTQATVHDVLNSFERIIKEQDQQYKLLENKMETRFLQLIKKCPTQLFHVICAELPYIQKVIQEKISAQLKLKLNYQESTLSDLNKKLEAKKTSIDHLNQQIKQQLSEKSSKEEISEYLNKLKKEYVAYSTDELTKKGSELIQDIAQSIKCLDNREQAGLVNNFLDEVLELVGEQQLDNDRDLIILQQAAENFKAKLNQEITSTRETIKQIQEKMEGTKQQITEFFEQIQARFTTPALPPSPAFFPVASEEGSVQKPDATATRPRAGTI